VRPLVLLLAAATLLPVLAGCLGPAATPAADKPGVSPTLFGAIKKEQKLLTMKDGIVLDNWVYRPDAPGQFPVIIESRPYFGNADPAASTEGQKFSKWLIHEMVPRGYVVVLHSIRGTGDSGGCYGQGGITEQTDEAATVELFAKEPYSDGKVGMIGKSYGGTTPWMAAVQKPPHLVTIVPVSGITEWYLYVANHGVWYDSGTAFNEAYPTSISLNQGPTPTQAQLDHYPEKICQDLIMDEAAGVTGAATATEDAFWQERNYQTKEAIAKINAANVSVYIVHGLQDWNVKPDNVVDIYNQLTVPKHMQLGQWDHQYPLRDDWGAELTRWFDHWLKGVENGIMGEAPVKLSASDGTWHDEADFPEARALPVALHPTAAGKLAAEPASGAATYVATAATAKDDAAPGQDKVVFAGPAASALTYYSGAPTLAFNATVLGPDTQFVATLFDIDGATWKAIDWAHLDARHRHGADKDEPITPGAAEAYTLRFYPWDFALLPGHSLGLAIAGAGGYAAPGGPTQAQVSIDLKGATLTIHELPSLVAEAPQPTMAKAADLGWTS
jgi:X-Pro dipeptidyl-peptidase